MRPSNTRASARSRERAAVGSSRDVASSSTNIPGSSSTMRARAICCASAGLSSLPPEPTFVSMPSGRSNTQPASTASSASRICASVASSRANRRLSVTEPTNTWCSWVTSETTACRSFSGMRVTAAPPILTAPDDGGLIPATSRPSVDLPAPEGPTIARVSPGLTCRSTPCSTSMPSR